MMAETGTEGAARRFREAYAQHRAAEGRGSDPGELAELPFARAGPLRRQWRVRARTFRRFMSAVIAPCAGRAAPRTLRVADLGAGNGWLCYRLALGGHEGLAIDTRTDAVDGLGAAAAYDTFVPMPFARIAGSFEALPIGDAQCDVAVFNASLHYALDLEAALADAARIVRSGGRIAILDSPFYQDEDEGLAMVEEKRRHAGRTFGVLADDLMAPPFIEFLTQARLAAASRRSGLDWRRQRVLYPLRYEARPWLARLRGDRTPSRFDLWQAVVP